MKKESKANGITLVALVITVIILLILTGIVISLIVGENGIIQKAQEAKENMIQASKDEEKILNNLLGEFENGNGSGNGSSSNEEDISNATAREILSGYKAYSEGNLLIGTMPNREAVSQNLSAGESYTIPEGYHNGSGVIEAKDLASQTQATATAGDIIQGKTAYVNGKLVKGTGANFKNTPKLAYGWGNTEVTPVTLNNAIPGKQYIVVIGVGARWWGGWKSPGIVVSGGNIISNTFTKQDATWSDSGKCGYVMTMIAIIKATSTTVSVKTDFGRTGEATIGLITICSYD